jgi:glycosyltransferase involved in cell wall biosynthesis
MLPHFVRATLKILSSAVYRKVDLVHLNVASHGSAVRKILLGAISIFICRNKTIFQMHGGGFRDYFEGLSFYTRLAILKVLNSSNGVLVFGKSSREDYESVGVKSHLIQVALMGCPDLESNTNIAEELENFIPINDQSVSILFAGDLNDNKGFPLILQSISDLKKNGVSMQLIVAGGGNLKHWQSVCKAIGIESNILFVGYVSKTSIQYYLKKSKALILASKLECMPVSVIECLASRTVPITTLAGNLSDVLDANCAIIIRNQTLESVTKSLLNFQEVLLSGQITSMADEAKEVWKNQFDVKVTTMKLETLWKSTIEAKS